MKNEVLLASSPIPGVPAVVRCHTVEQRATLEAREREAMRELLGVEGDRGTTAELYDALQYAVMTAVMVEALVRGLA